MSDTGTPITDYELERFGERDTEGNIRPRASFTRQLERALATARRDALEEAAKVCEELQDALDRQKWPDGYACSAAIRARGEGTK